MKQTINNSLSQSIIRWFFVYHSGSNWNLEMWFLRVGENRSTRRKTSWSKGVACERQTFLLAHRRLGTFDVPPRETSFIGDERGETSAVRRLVRERTDNKLNPHKLPLTRDGFNGSCGAVNVCDGAGGHFPEVIEHYF